MSSKQPLSPSVTVGDKIVMVGPPTWSGIKSLVSAASDADLPIPTIATDRVQEVFDSLRAALAGGAMAQAEANISIYGLIAGLVADNLPILQQWFFKHPPLITALVLAGSNLGSAEADSLSAGQLVRVARACWKALIDDGFFTEVADFFGGLLATATTATAGSDSQPNGPSPSASDSPPANSPAPASEST